MAKHRNKGLRKVCDCPRRQWSKCSHPWYFSFQHRGTHHRFSLDRHFGKSFDSKTDAKTAAEQADIRMTPLLIPASNFAGKGPASVGSYSSIGPFGTYDMAGNAQEWAWNETDSGFRFILGGAWSSPTYQFNQPDAMPPFDRGALNGFRCALYSTPPRESLLAPVRRNSRDYSLEKPVGDEAFRIIRSVYTYTPRELKATADEIDDGSPYWRKEKVSFSAAYGDERVTALVFLPKNTKSPYQALVYHPSAGAQSSTFAGMEGFNRMEFIIRSGPAVTSGPSTASSLRRGQLPRERSASSSDSRTCGSRSSTW